MRNSLGVRIVVVLLAAAFVTPSPAFAGCEFWDCTVGEDGSAGCWIRFQPTGDYALGCRVRCDRGNTGGGCWCVFDSSCYMI